MPANYLLLQDRAERQTEEKSVMKKYRTLLLVITTVASFIGFIIYKHEYDRLKYTLEYLEVFGEPPKDEGNNQQSQCSLAFQHRASTAPAEWTKVATDIAVYSSFWDEDNGLVEPKIRTVALVEKSQLPASELKIKLYYESGDTLDAVCEMENTEKREHLSGEANNYHVVFLVCEPIVTKDRESLARVMPHSIQFGVGHGRWSGLKPVQESNGFKTIEDRSAICVLPAEDNIKTINIVEFISFYQVLGFNKFVFYGNALTPTSRKLLDKFVDEMNIVIEEKSYNLIPSLQTLNANMSKESKMNLDYIVRRTIELDCQYRHRDSYENIIILQTNEFIITTKKDTISNLMRTLSTLGRRKKQIAEFHLSSQSVCIDTDHSVNKSPLLLGQQIRSAAKGITEDGLAILRPHLLTTSLGMVPMAGVMKVQHISPATATVYRFGKCSEQNKHEDVLHLPTRTNFVSLIESSLLFRKWKVNSVN